MRKPKRARLGSSFEDFLKETGDYGAVNNAALKRVLAWQNWSTSGRPRASPKSNLPRF